MRVLQLVHTAMQHEPPVSAMGRLLADRGHAVRCVGYWSDGLNKQEEPWPGYELYRIDRGSYASWPRLLRGGLRFAAYSRGLDAVVRDFAPDIVIPYGYDVLPLAFRFSPNDRRVVYYCTEYSSAPTWREYATGWGFLKRLERAHVKRVGILVSVEENRARIQGQDWRRKVDYVVLNSPCYEEALECRAVQQLTVPKGLIRLVYAGSIARRNCLKQLMDAVSRVPDVDLSIVGRIEPSYQREFASSLAKCATDSNGRARYLGAVPYTSLAELLMHFDVGVALYSGDQTNVRFASPAKVFDYMRSGLAVLATAQPTPADVIRASASGVVIDIAQPDALPDTLQQLASNPENVLGMRRNAIAAFREHFAYQRQALQLVQQIEKICIER